jgi:hypothetical protein
MTLLMELRPRVSATANEAGRGSKISLEFLFQSDKKRKEVFQ